MADESVRVVDPYYFTPEWIALRTRVVQMNRSVCAYCGCQGFQADHVVPRSKGGEDAIGNLVCACARCNELLGGRLFGSFDEKKAWLLAELKRLVAAKPIPTTPQLCAYKRISKVRGCSNLAIPGSSYCHGHHYLILAQRKQSVAKPSKKRRNRRG